MILIQIHKIEVGTVRTTDCSVKKRVKRSFSVNLLLMVRFLPFLCPVRWETDDSSCSLRS